MSSQEVEHGEELPPPKNEGNIVRIPELEVGEKVVVRTDHSSDKDRTLTVESEGGEMDPQGLLTRKNGDGYTLSGYGTEYRLSTEESMGGHWRRVLLTYKSDPYGEEVAEIERVDA